MSAKPLIFLVPGERFELPTNGLQNRLNPLTRPHEGQLKPTRKPQEALVHGHKLAYVCHEGTQTITPRFVTPM
jgi:hypothetical protein